MNLSSVPANPSGHWLYRWTDDSGQEWACCAADHGPLCRLCQQVNDDVTRGCLDNVASGLMHVRAKPNGEFQLSMTPEGKKRAEALIASEPWAREMADNLTLADMERPLGGDES